MNDIMLNSDSDTLGAESRSSPRTRTKKKTTDPRHNALRNYYFSWQVVRSTPSSRAATEVVWPRPRKKKQLQKEEEKRKKNPFEIADMIAEETRLRKKRRKDRRFHEKRADFLACSNPRRLEWRERDAQECDERKCLSPSLSPFVIRTPGVVLTLLLLLLCCGGVRHTMADDTSGEGSLTVTGKKEHTHTSTRFMKANSISWLEHTSPFVCGTTSNADRLPYIPVAWFINK